MIMVWEWKVTAQDQCLIGLYSRAGAEREPAGNEAGWQVETRPQRTPMASLRWLWLYWINNINRFVSQGSNTVWTWRSKAGSGLLDGWFGVKKLRSRIQVLPEFRWLRMKAGGMEGMPRKKGTEETSIFTIKALKTDFLSWFWIRRETDIWGLMTV